MGSWLCRSSLAAKGGGVVVPPRKMSSASVSWGGGVGWMGGDLTDLVSGLEEWWWWSRLGRGGSVMGRGYPCVQVGWGGGRRSGVG